MSGVPGGFPRLNWKSPQAQGLVACWLAPGQFGGNLLQNVSNQRGNEYDAVLAAGSARPTWQYHPVLGSVLTFDGNDYASTPATDRFNGADRWFTIAFWFTTTGTTTRRFLAHGGDAYSDGWMVYNSDGYLRMYGRDFYVALMRDTATRVNDGMLHHACIEFYGDTTGTSGHAINIYIDGKINQGALSKDRAYAGMTTTLEFGRRTSGDYHIGLLADVRFYDGQRAAYLAPAIFTPATRWELYAPPRKVWLFGDGSAPTPPPNAPSDLTATATGSDTIALAWTDNSDDETGFRIQRSLNGSTWADLDTAAADATTYSDETCDPNTTYYYRVCAYSGAADSAYTDAASAKTPPDAATLAYKYLVIDGGQIKQTDGRYVALVDGVPEPHTVAGVAWLYVDQTTGDLTVKFGDGHMTVLAADS